MTLDNNEMTGVLKVLGTLDIESAGALREAFLQAYSRQSGLEMDLAEVDACDAAGLQVLLAGQKQASALGKDFRLAAVSACVAETASALGITITGCASTGSRRHQYAV